MREAGSVHQNELGVGSGFSRVAKDFIAHFEVRDAFSNGSDAAGDIASRCPRKLKLEDLTQETLATPRIDAVHAGVVVLDKYLSGRWGRNWNFVDMKRRSIIIDT